MGTTGLSKPRLERLHQVLTGYVERKEIPDPAEAMIGILFRQRMMDTPEPPKVFKDFWTLAYAAME